MGTLPAAGNEISMARTGAAYYNTPTNVEVSIGNSAAVRHLNASIGRGVTTTTSFSAVFGGLTTPYPY